MQEKLLFCYSVITLLCEPDHTSGISCILIFIFVCSFLPMRRGTHAGTDLGTLFKNLRPRALGQRCNIAQFEKCRFLIHNLLLFILPLLHYLSIKILVNFHKHISVFFKSVIAVKISACLTPLYIYTFNTFIYKINLNTKIDFEKIIIQF